MIRDGAEMYLASNTTVSAATSSMRGIKTTATPANARTIGMGDVYRGLMLWFFGVIGADNQTATFKLWRRKKIVPEAQGTRVPAGASVHRMLVGTGTVTFSSNAACAVPTGTNIPFPSGCQFADTVTFTVDTEFQTLIDTIGGGALEVAKAYSPADDGTSGIGMLAVADIFDGSEFELELLKGTCTSVNAVVDLVR